VFVGGMWGDVEIRVSFGDQMTSFPSCNVVCGSLKQDSFIVESRMSHRSTHVL